MKNIFLTMLPVVCLTACAIPTPVYTPTVSSNVIDTESGLINISTKYCGDDCMGLAMRKAQEVCHPRGYVIKSSENEDGYVIHHVRIMDVRLTVRCANG